jgi:hypothetical protein
MKYINLFGVALAAGFAGAALWLVQQAGPSEYDAYWERLACVGCPEPGCPSPFPGICDDES